jgi:hypothetical protein
MIAMTGLTDDLYKTVRDKLVFRKEQMPSHRDKEDTGHERCKHSPQKKEW